MNPNTPMILAPAGNTNAFLAAIAAGADAIYCGLKIFSARMEADNFGIEELSRLAALAQSKQIKVYIAFNSIIKESEQDKVFKILTKLCQFVEFDALIVQDLAIIPLAKKAGFKKEFHVSTLGNCTFPLGLETAKKAGFSRVVLPREFTIDEIKEMAQHTPDDMALEVFVHGALCYSVSGRCYWSSWFGGKSALRGRCVQPCRRIYEQKDQKKRHFSCMDFSADVLVKVLKEIPQVTTWKIEGRKKSPHYVYYTVKAYRTLRDDPTRKKEALAYLDYAMGRQFSHYNLLSQRVQNPLDHTSETGSGLFLGRVKNPPEPYFITQEELFSGDLLRIGYEENEFHDIQKVTRAIPKKGKFYLSKRSKYKVKTGTPVFIIDRRGPELASLIKGLESELETIEKIQVGPILDTHSPEKRMSNPGSSKKRPVELTVYRGKQMPGAHHGDSGMWISANAYGNKPSGRTWLWLDPLIFPGEENICRSYVDQAIKKGATNFVLNAFWQLGLFKDPQKLNLWAGPFCNITNSMTINLMKRHGFSGAIVSPELDKDTFLCLPRTSDLPLGVVTYANWPLAVSRIISPDLTPGLMFQSPKGEGAWISKSNNIYYTFPNWPLDLSAQMEELQGAGYSMFVSLRENVPKGVKMKPRPGTWNWNLKLL
ncbi:MAG: U32 family peptidase [Proteobacteria bacterium]|nr:U32 family peptidase [Desulfobacula sp.]MBU4133501.1 U32 family peptidase [Pseudomonadota bacterium]